MKTSEMMAMLEENPNLKFEFKGHTVTVGVGGFLSMSYHEGYSSGPHGNLAIKNADWQLVREPVPVWEAIKAWKEGRTITVNCSECNYSPIQKCSFKGSDEPKDFCDEAMRNGTWYIDEQEG